jgi:hypothetical protein
MISFRRNTADRAMAAAPPTLADFAAALPLADVDAMARSGGAWNAYVAAHPVPTSRHAWDGRRYKFGRAAANEVTDEDLIGSYDAEVDR